MSTTVHPKCADACHALLEACKAVVGFGYTENPASYATSDYVSKKAIALVRAAIAKTEETR